MMISTGDSRRSTNWLPRAVTWEELVDRMREPRRTRETVAEYGAMSRDEKAEAKDIGGFVGGRIHGGNRKSGNITDRQLISLDADYADMSLWESWKLMIGGRALMHTTHSHTPQKPRLRFLIPLKRPVTAQEYEPVARYLAAQMDIEAFDDTTYEPSRLMYWPSCPKDGEYLFEAMDGPVCDPDAILGMYPDWRDMRYWPHSSRQEKIIRRMGEKQGDPLTKPGIVGAFNRAYSITAAIGKFLPEVYTPCGPGRWTYAKGSTVGGGVTYDGDTFLYSHHDTDPVGGRLCNAFDLVRLHLYGDRDAGHEDSSLSDAPSQLAMKALCAGDEAVRSELAEAIRRDPSEAFDAQDAGNAGRLERFADDMTEQGAAKDFVDQYGQNLRYNSAFGWMFWDGQRWLLNAEAEARMLMMCYTDSLYGQARIALQTAADKTAKDRATALLRQAVKLRTAGGLSSLVNFTKAIVNDSRTEDYDARPWDLNTPGGIIDLRTGDVRPHSKEAKATKMTAVSAAQTYRPGAAGYAEWESFIRHITAGDADFARYLQTLAGMAAVGAVYEEGLVISQGPGGNGKSTFFGALRKVLGDYARSINADVLVATGGRTDQSYVAALRGARLVVMGETEEGAKFGVAQMKRLTSRDTISARALYKDPIEFEPTHTTIMHTNHLPTLKSLDGGTRRRIAVAPFPATLPPERVITNYEALLVERCGPVILRWIVEGARMFYNADCKLQKPDVVLQATNRYLEGEDWMKAFLDECCDVGSGYAVTAGQLREKYKAYCASTREFERAAKAFNTALRLHGFESQHTMRGTLWTGLRVRDAFGESGVMQG